MARPMKSATTKKSFGLTWERDTDMNFFFEVLIGGLLSGIMYTLVAIGFVLIYKASCVFNFAQGAMVFFAALTCVGFNEVFGLSLWIAIPLTMLVMVVLGL